ncbi:MAG: hypothetical protein IT269_05565, partial [Saprospiraceae bacterium]|nr:hypothetical protein [Saprospiraceae bacterium]
EYAFALGMKGDQKSAHTVYSSIAEQMAAYTSSDFPLRYTYFGKNFVIKWDDYAPSQGEFLSGYAETSYNNGAYQDAANYGRKGLNHSHATGWLKYVALHKILDVYTKAPQYVPVSERLELAQRSIKMYDAMPESEKETIAKYKYPTVIRGADILLEEALSKNDRESISRCADVAPILIKVGKTDPQTLEILELCYKNNLPGDQAFAEAAEQHARKMKGSAPVNSSFIALAATERLAYMTAATDCERMAKIAGLYGYWDRPEKEKEWLKKSNTCNSDRIKAEKKAAKQARRSNSGFNMYAGAYILPLFSSSEKRDYGGVLNIGGRKTMIEFSYLKIQKKKENTFDMWAREIDAEQDDLSTWDGYYAHVQPKFMKRSMYWGLLLGTAHKEFSTMTVNVVNDATTAAGTADFTPKVEQYIAMLNFGSMPLFKGFGADVYFGIGANYSRFDAGTTINRAEYTIENPILENRKETYFGLIMRVGMTMGINFGNGNMR